MIWHVFNTAFGLYGRKYSKEWDIILNKILDDGDICGKCAYTLTIKYNGKNVTIWVNNKYYEYGYQYMIDDFFVPSSMQFRPKYKTMKRLNKITQELDEVYK